jgi:hypothetical protein
MAQMADRAPATPRIGESCADYRSEIELALKPSRGVPRWLRLEVRHGFLRAVVNPPRSNHGPWLAWRQASLDECDVHAVGNAPMLGVGGCVFEITAGEAEKIIETFGVRDKRVSSAGDGQ